MANQKGRGKILIILGILGIILVCSWDIITGKPVNDISGPKSIMALAISIILIILGIIKIKNKKEIK